jgi:hypothetical protein
VALFELATGAEVAFLALPQAGEDHPFGNIAFDGTGALLTNHFAGFFRWPVRPDPTRSGRWTVGPPERLPFFPGDRPIAASRDGRVVAQGMWAGYDMERYAGGWILHPNSPRPRWVGRGSSVFSTDVSPDGRWVAFSERVYDSVTGRRVWQGADGDFCRFRPDGL